MKEVFEFPIYENDEIREKIEIKKEISKIIKRQKEIDKSFKEKVLEESLSVFIIGFIIDAAASSGDVSWESFKATGASIIVASYWLTFRYIKKNIQEIILEKKEKKRKKRLDILEKKWPDTEFCKIPEKELTGKIIQLIPDLPNHITKSAL